VNAVCLAGGGEKEKSHISFGVIRSSSSQKKGRATFSKRQLLVFEQGGRGANKPDPTRRDVDCPLLRGEKKEWESVRLRPSIGEGIEKGRSPSPPWHLSRKGGRIKILEISFDEKRVRERREEVQPPFRQEGEGSISPYTEGGRGRRKEGLKNAQT